MSDMKRLLGDQQVDDQGNKENKHLSDNGTKECMWCVRSHDKDRCTNRVSQIEVSNGEHLIVETVDEDSKSGESEEEDLPSLSWDDGHADQETVEESDDEK